MRVFSIFLLALISFSCSSQQKRTMTQDEYYRMIDSMHTIKSSPEERAKLLESQEKMVIKGPDGKRLTLAEADQLRLQPGVRLASARYNLFGQLVARYEYVSKWEGKEAVEFEVEDEKGNAITLQSLKGKVVVINLWALGCAPCIYEIPELNEVVAAFVGQPVEFLAFGMDQPERIDAFLGKRDLDFHYRQIRPSLTTVKYGEKYDISGWPGHIIVDQQGNVAYLWVGNSWRDDGPSTRQVLIDRIQDVLGALEDH